MNSNLKKYLIRNFNLPVILTVVAYFFYNAKTVKELCIYFCVFFTLNWIFDATFVEWSIKRGQELGKQKKDKKDNEVDY